MKHKIKSVGMSRIGVSKPIGKEWADKIRKLQEEKTKETKK